MDYKLAKQLKKAGFPHAWCKDFDSAVREDHPEDCKCLPTLEELIEACGDEFEEFSQKPNSGTQILADGKEVNFRACGKEGRYALGNTPSEAVANLYLKLNAPQ